MLSNHLILCCPLLLLPSTFPTRLPWHLSWWRICLQCRRPQFSFWAGKIHWRRDRLPTPVFLGFPGGSAGEESACNAGDLGFIPGLGRSPGEGKGYPLHILGLENSMDCIVHGVAKSWTQLRDFHSLFPALGSFPLSCLFTSGDQSIGASSSVLPVIFKVDFL